MCIANCANSYNALTPTTNPVWKTILVGGLNGGGRGYYALDITNPASPTLLWEFTTTAGIGKIKDDDLGFTYGQAVITQRTDGRWVVVVTSGYDNGNTAPTLAAQTPAGSGKGFLFVLDAGTGTILSKIATGAGTANAPSGLAKIAGFNAEPRATRWATSTAATCSATSGASMSTPAPRGRRHRRRAEIRDPIRR